uniref:Putative cystatin n=1 Tax=Ornithodoros turicata TaxID=34597 RepID=A0A2R5LGH7_9ACAR
MMHFAVVVLALATGCLATRRFEIYGGWTWVDPNSNPRYLELAHFAVGQQTRGLEYYNTVVEVTSASEQVVSGMNYRLTFRVAPSNCRVADTVYSKERCRPTPNAEIKECRATIYDIPWRRIREVTSFTC